MHLTQASSIITINIKKINQLTWQSYELRK